MEESYTLQALQAVRIIGRLLNCVQLKPPAPILSYIQETVGELVSKTDFGTKDAGVTLTIEKSGDMSHQFMFEKWEETAITIGRLSKICLSEFGEISLTTKEKPGLKYITVHFKSA